MKLAFDFDGTIANTNQMKSILFEERHGIKLPGWQCDRTDAVPIVGLEAYEDVGNIVFERKSTLETPPLEDALKYIPALAEKADIYLLTARPQRWLDFAAEWLDKYDLTRYFERLLSSHIVDREWRPKLEICEENNFELLLEDDPRHFRVNGFHQIKKVLIKDGCLELPDLSGDIHMVRNWREFYGWCEREVFKKF